jgi:NAD(P)-dependent dehydrogenase (short-subunit alcohol dehydrogenase family)
VTTVAVITGAAGGMGAACARVLAPAADVLLLTDRRADRLAAVADAVATTSDTRVHQHAADLAAPDAAEGLAARVGELGELRSLVHTAGLSPEMARWEQILQVDLVAVARLLDAHLPLVQPGSVAVCIASIAGHMGDSGADDDTVLDEPEAPDIAARYRDALRTDPDSGWTYALTKRAVIRLCERAAVPWGARGGRVVSLSPGMIDTEMGRLELEHNPIPAQLAAATPVQVGRTDGETVLPGRIADIAGAVAFLCSDAAGFVSGCDLRVDGGLVGAIRQPQP